MAGITQTSPSHLDQVCELLELTFRVALPRVGFVLSSALTTVLRLRFHHWRPQVLKLEELKEKTPEEVAAIWLKVVRIIASVVCLVFWFFTHLHSGLSIAEHCLALS